MILLRVLVVPSPHHLSARMHLSFICVVRTRQRWKNFAAAPDDNRQFQGFHTDTGPAFDAQ